MAVNIDYFLKQKFKEYELAGALRTVDLYYNIENQYLRHLFAILHQEFNRLFKFMYSKTNGHFNADESRQLIDYIELYEDMEYVLKNTAYSFTINDEYKKLINQCKGFLARSNGSEIPDDLNRINILDYEPIFFMKRTINITRKNTENYTYPIKLIGEGSYAQVFKYKDEFYDKNFVIKRAKKELTEKELIRFKKEYTTMKELKSPYVLEVYRYDDNKKEYYAEFADQTLYDYISNNNNQLDLIKRKKLAYQIFKAFSYIHSKGYLHRDISLTNILLINYDDVNVVKVSDFGQVKDENSNLTSTNSDLQGSLNDSNLAIIGYKNYSIEHETFALTRLILFVMTGRRNLDEIKDKKLKEFVLKGTNPDLKQRYKSVDEMKEAFKKIYL